MCQILDLILCNLSTALDKTLGCWCHEALAWQTSLCLALSTPPSILFKHCGGPGYMLCSAGGIPVSCSNIVVGSHTGPLTQVHWELSCIALHVTLSEFQLHIVTPIHQTSPCGATPPFQGLSHLILPTALRFGVWIWCLYTCHWEVVVEWTSTVELHTCFNPHMLNSALHLRRGMAVRKLILQWKFI